MEPNWDVFDSAIILGARGKKVQGVRGGREIELHKSFPGGEDRRGKLGNSGQKV